MQLLPIGDMDKENFYRLLENNLLLNNDTLPEIRLLTEQYPCFHAAWILLIKNLQQTGDQELENCIRNSAIKIPDRKILYNFLFANTQNEASGYYIEQTETVMNSSIDEGKEREGNRLIDKFLSGDAGPIRIEKDYETEAGPDNEVVSRSLAESDELITETLANIYAEQKKYDKALDAFKKLSLKYPEKSVYFAARIKEIEKYLK
jgi:tetratricopeptide (TPR) repeat protein